MKSEGRTNIMLHPLQVFRLLEVAWQLQAAIAQKASRQ